MFQPIPRTEARTCSSTAAPAVATKQYQQQDDLCGVSRRELLRVMRDLSSYQMPFLVENTREKRLEGCTTPSKRKLGSIMVVYNLKEAKCAIKFRGPHVSLVVTQLLMQYSSGAYILRANVLQFVCPSSTLQALQPESFLAYPIQHFVHPQSIGIVSKHCPSYHKPTIQDHLNPQPCRRLALTDTYPTNRKSTTP